MYKTLNDAVLSYKWFTQNMIGFVNNIFQKLYGNDLYVFKRFIAFTHKRDLVMKQIKSI